MKNQFAVIHTGTNEITSIAARWTRGGDYVIEGFSRTSAKGFREGIVIDAKVFARKGVDKDERSKAIEAQEKARNLKNQAEQMKLIMIMNV